MENEIANTIVKFDGWFELVVGFFGAAVSALLGAWFGALAAGRISNRQAEIESLERELSSCNSAIVLSQNIVSNCVNLKIQFVKKYVEEYEEDLSRFNLLMDALDRRTVPPSQIIRQNLNNVIFQPTRAPVHRLANKLHDEIKMLPRATALSGILETTWSDLEGVMHNRNQYIEKVGKLDLDDKELIHKYFGYPKDDKSATDQRYPNMMRAIADLNNDCLFFSMQILEDLMFRASFLVEKVKSIDSRRELKFVRATLNITPDIQPDKEKYKDWISIPQSLGG